MTREQKKRQGVQESKENNDREDKRTKNNNIVLISEKAIYGKKVQSISQEVHSEILNSLKVSKNNE